MLLDRGPNAGTIGQFTSTMMIILDSFLILALLWLAWRALASADLFKGIVLFIGFGLLLALVWVRLNAPDVALAEAAIGSGLTGALLLATLGKLKRMDDIGPQTSDAPHPVLSEKVVFPVGLLALTLLLGWAVYSLPANGGLSEVARANLDKSGVSNPVTAVLLNFRAYDTLLEIAVLLLAVAAVWSVAMAAGEKKHQPPQLVQTVVVNLLAPVMLVVAGYLLWIGSKAPGGAFQAGAVLGGVGVLLVLSRPELATLRNYWLLRVALVAGTIVFLAVGVLGMVTEGRLLEYPLRWAGWLILFIETAATISIGLTLAVLFVGEKPSNKSPQK